MSSNPPLLQHTRLRRPLGELGPGQSGSPVSNSTANRDELNIAVVETNIEQVGEIELAECKKRADSILRPSRADEATGAAPEVTGEAR